jgi:trimeric autotransporter adhesin
LKRILHVVLFLVLILVCGHEGYCQIITTVAGNGTYGYSGDGGSATAAMIYNPRTVASDMNGGFYMSLFGGGGGIGYAGRIRRVDSTGNISTYVGTGTVGFGGDGGPASAAQLWGGDVATDAVGNLYIADGYNGRIRKVNTSGIITTFAGNGTVGYSGDGGPATVAALGSLSTSGWSEMRLAADPYGNVYVYLFLYNKIRKIDTAGIITTYAGTGATSSSGDGGLATAATFGLLYGIAADGSGNVFISDDTYKRIRKINSTGFISAYAGTGMAGSAGDGGPATAAYLKNEGISVDTCGNLYIADNGNQRVRKIDTSGIINTVAGTGAFGFSGDGKIVGSA